MTDLPSTGGERDDDPDVYENPTIEALDRDLHAVLQRTDLRLMLFIGIALVAVYLPDYVALPPVATPLLDTIAVIAILGGIGFTIYSSVKGKREVARRYGVVCPACGFRPKVNDTVVTADVGLCPRCGAELPVRQP